MTKQRCGLAASALGAAGVAGLASVRRLGRRSGVTDADLTMPLPGDDLVPGARVVIDRAVLLPATPDAVWPWLVQLGKDRGGWYLPGWIERLGIPAGSRSLRRIEPGLQTLAVGDDVPDWGPGDPVFRAALIDPPHTLVWLSKRQRSAGWRWPTDAADDVMVLSWALVLRPDAAGSRLHLRLRFNRLGGRAQPVIAIAGGIFDWLTVELLARGLRERLG